MANADSGIVFNTSSGTVKGGITVSTLAVQGIINIKRIVWSDGSVQISSPTSAFTGGITSRVSALEANVSTAVHTTQSYADPSWITSLSTTKINLSTVTSALNGKLTIPATETIADLPTLTAPAGTLIIVTNASSPYSYCVSTANVQDSWVLMNQTINCQ